MVRHSAIEDPYALADDWQFRALCRFLQLLASLWQEWPTKLKIKTRDTGDQGKAMAELQLILKPHGTSVDVRCVPAKGPYRVDFHDRRIIFQPDLNNTRRRVTVLLTGGVDRYLDQRFECGIITHRSL